MFLINTIFSFLRIKKKKAYENWKHQKYCDNYLEYKRTVNTPRSFTVIESANWPN